MNVLTNSVIKKLIIVAITLIMLTNFIMPNYVYAIKAKDIPMWALSGLLYVVGTIGDLGMSILQKVMVGVWDLEDSNGFNIKYSPGLIFANKIPMLDVNFIGGGKKTEYISDNTNLLSSSELEKQIESVNNNSFECIDIGNKATSGSIERFNRDDCTGR